MGQPNGSLRIIARGRTHIFRFTNTTVWGDHDDKKGEPPRFYIYRPDAGLIWEHQNLKLYEQLRDEAGPLIWPHRLFLQAAKDGVLPESSIWGGEGAPSRDDVHSFSRSEETSMNLGFTFLTLIQIPDFRREDCPLSLFPSWAGYVEPRP